MGIFGKKDVEKLSEALSDPMMEIFMAVAGHRSVAELESNLASHASSVRELTSGMAAGDIEAAYQKYFQDHGRIMADALAENGEDPSLLISLQREWLGTQTLALFSRPTQPGYAPSPGRPWSCDVSTAEFTWVESLRPVEPLISDYGTLVDVTPRLGQVRGGMAFGGMILTDTGVVISPPWANVDEAVVARSGDIIATGVPANTFLDLPEVFDLGQKTGANTNQWNGHAPQGLVSPDQNLYFGSSREHYFEMTKIALPVQAIDAAGDVCVSVEYEHADRSYHIAQIAPNGERRYFAIGGSTIQVSPDLQWVLTRDNQSTLIVSIVDGTTIEVPVPAVLSASWWPARSASTICLLQGTEQGEQFVAFDLEHNALLRGPLLNHPFARGEYGPYFNDLRVHPSENRALIGARAESGNQVSVSTVDLTTGSLTVLRPRHFDPVSEQYLIVDSSWRWIDRPANRPVVLHPDLAATALRPDYAPPSRTNSAVAKDTHDLTITLTKAILDHMADAHRLRPELLRSYEAHRSYADAPSEGLTEWLAMLIERNRETLAGMPTDRGEWDKSIHAFAALANGLELVHRGQASQINWQQDRNS